MAQGQRFTPWGRSQDHYTVANGIDCYLTAGHGGVHLDWLRTRQLRQVWPEAFGSVICSGEDFDRDGSSWWEEDCAVTFPQAEWPGLFAAAYNARAAREWTADEIELIALRSVRHWAPQALTRRYAVRLEWLEAKPVPHEEGDQR